MLRLLRRLIGRRDAMAKAGRRTSGEVFARAIVDSEVILCGALHNDGLDPATLTQEQMLAEIESAATALSQLEEFEPFVYERDGESCLPFFSSQAHGETFVGEYSKSRGRVFGFQTVTVQGSVIASWVGQVESMVLNDGTPDQRPLTVEEMQRLGRAQAGSGDPDAPPSPPAASD